MPTVTETQNYLNAVKTPTIITPATLNGAIKTFVSSFGDARQQIAAWATLLQDSEMAEPDEVLRGKLQVMDATAIVMCRDNNIPLRVFNLTTAGSLLRIMRGEALGTLVDNGLEQMQEAVSD
ncbi:MAG: hypothetical protein IH927_02600 [Proteobacteria bacterium]|nr:hypothetical protein [Pseudomonadota bacterium]